MGKVQPTIEIDGLSKRYSRKADFAVKDLKLSVGTGEIYGFLGPNGAGKTTTIRLLLNFIQPTAGRAAIGGRDSVSEAVAIKHSVGYIAGDVSLYPKMTGHQFLDYMAEMHPLKRQGYQAELASRFKADLGKKIRDLSSGNRQKVAIIQAFMHQPSILILDEPAAGLDPLMQEVFFGLLKETKAAGACIFFSSHNLAEVQKVCDRVGFIRSGRLVAERDINAASAAAAKIFDIGFNEPMPKAELKAIPAAKVEFKSAKQATIHMHGDLGPMFRVLAKHKVQTINQRGLNLGEEFLRFYSSGQKEAESETSK